MSFASGMTVPRTYTESLIARRRWLPLLCLLLVAFMVAAQALHVHTGKFSNHENCAICQVANAPSAASRVMSLAIVLIVAAFPTLAPSPAPLLSLQAFSLFCRPPPRV